jgi:hypothetical protein
MTKKIALACGIFSIAFGVLGFIPNPLVGPGSFFEANQIYDMARIAFGIILLGVATLEPARAHLWLQVLGVVYLLRAIMGFLLVPHSGYLFHALSVNTADNFLHLAIGLILLVPSFLSVQHTPTSEKVR